jgi:hypothetical protein
MPRVGPITWGYIPAVLLFASFGCNGSATMSGKVLYDNQPIPEGHLRLTPAKGPPIATEIANGEYAFDAEDGLAVGKYTVYVIATRKTGKSFVSPEPKMIDGQPVEGAPPERIEEVEQYIPAKHNRSSELLVVVAAGENRRDFELDK